MFYLSVSLNSETLKGNGSRVQILLIFQLNFKKVILLESIKGTYFQIGIASIYNDQIQSFVERVPFVEHFCLI